MVANFWRWVGSSLLKLARARAREREYVKWASAILAVCLIGRSSTADRKSARRASSLSCFFRKTLVIALRRLNRGVFAELFHKDVGYKYLNYLV